MIYITHICVRGVVFRPAMVSILWNKFRVRTLWRMKIQRHHSIREFHPSERIEHRWDDGVSGEFSKKKRKRRGKDVRTIMRSWKMCNIYSTRSLSSKEKALNAKVVLQLGLYVSLSWFTPFSRAIWCIASRVGCCGRRRKVKRLCRENIWLYECVTRMGLTASQRLFRTFFLLGSCANGAKVAGSYYIWSASLFSLQEPMYNSFFLVPSLLRSMFFALAILISAFSTLFPLEWFALKYEYLRSAKKNPDVIRVSPTNGNCSEAPTYRLHDAENTINAFHANSATHWKPPQGQFLWKNGVAQMLHYSSRWNTLKMFEVQCFFHSRAIKNIENLKN